MSTKDQEFCELHLVFAFSHFQTHSRFFWNWFVINWLLSSFLKGNIYYLKTHFMELSFQNVSWSYLLITFKKYCIRKDYIGWHLLVRIANNNIEDFQENWIYTQGLFGKYLYKVKSMLGPIAFLCCLKSLQETTILRFAIFENKISHKNVQKYWFC